MISNIILTVIVFGLPILFWFLNRKETKKREKYVGVSFMDSDGNYKINEKKNGKKTYFYPTFYSEDLGQTPFVEIATDKAVRFLKEMDAFRFISDYINWKFRERELQRRRSEKYLHIYMIIAVVAFFILHH